MLQMNKAEAKAFAKDNIIITFLNISSKIFLLRNISVFRIRILCLSPSLSISLSPLPPLPPPRSLPPSFPLSHDQNSSKNCKKRPTTRLDPLVRLNPLTSEISPPLPNYGV